jgi:hypothetical protein
LTWISPLYWMMPSFLNLFMKKLTRDRVQQIARIIARPPSLSRLGALKSQTRHVQPIDKCIDDPAHVIVRNQLFQSDRKEGCLGPAFALHIAHKKDALAFTRSPSEN